MNQFLSYAHFWNPYGVVIRMVKEWRKVWKWEQFLCTAFSLIRLHRCNWFHCALPPSLAGQSEFTFSRSTALPPMHPPPALALDVSVIQRSVLPLNVSARQQPVLALDVSVIQRSVLPLNVSARQQPVLALDVSLIQRSVLPLDVSARQQPTSLSHTVILFNSRYLLSVKSIFSTCKEWAYICMLPASADNCWGNRFKFRWE